MNAQWTSLLERFAARAGIGPLQTNARGACVLGVRNGGKIILEPPQAGGAAAFLGLLWKVPETAEARLRLYDALLRAQGEWRHARPDVFATPPGLDQVVLTRPVAVESLDAGAFGQALMDFIDHYLVWRERAQDEAIDPGSWSEAHASDERPDDDWIGPGVLRL